MSKSFNIGEDVLNISGDIEAYNQLWLKVKEVSKKYFIKFVSELKDIDDVDEFMEKAYHLGTEVHDEMFDEFSDEFMSLGCFDFSSNYLHNHRLYEKLMNPFFSYLLFMKNSCENAEEMGDIEKFQHDFNKMSRTQLSGGGFGIAVALSGMLMASAYNTASGLVYDAINTRKNWKTDNKVADLKAQIYQNAAPELMMKMLFTLENQLVIIADLLHIDYVEDEAKSTAILNNILSMKIKPELEKKAFLAALQANPYNYDAYKYMLKRYSNEEADILEVAAYFGMDFSAQVKEAHEYDSFYFKEPKNRNRVANRMSGVFEQLGITYNDFIDNNYWSEAGHYDLLISIIEKIKSIITKEEEEHLKIAEYGGYLPDMTEIREYCEKKITVLENIAQDVKSSIEAMKEAKEKRATDDEWVCIHYRKVFSKMPIIGEIKFLGDILDADSQVILKMFGGGYVSDIKNYLYLNDGKNELLVTSRHIYFVSLDKKQKSECYKFIDGKEVSYVNDNDSLKLKIFEDDALVSLEYKDESVYCELVNFINEIRPIGEFKVSEFYAEKFGGINCAVLGEYYEKGWGCKKDELSAVKEYFRGIILYDEPYCQYHIALKYLDGNGCLGKPNLQKAKCLMELSYNKNSRTAKKIAEIFPRVEEVSSCVWNDLFAGPEFENTELKEYVDLLLDTRNSIESCSLDKSDVFNSLKQVENIYGEDPQGVPDVKFSPMYDMTEETRKTWNGRAILGRLVDEKDTIALLYNSKGQYVLFLTFGIYLSDVKQYYYKDIASFCCEDNKVSIVLKKSPNTKIPIFEYYSMRREGIPFQRYLAKIFGVEPVFTGIKEVGFSNLISNIGDVINYATISQWCSYDAMICKMLNGFYWGTDIKAAKSQNAISSYASNYIIDSQYIYALYDNTIFGSAKEGFLVHYYGIASSTMGCFVLYSDIESIEVAASAIILHLKNGTNTTFWNFARAEEAYALFALFGEMLICNINKRYARVYPDCDRIELYIN